MRYIDFHGVILGRTPWSPGSVGPALVHSGVVFVGVLRDLRRRECEICIRCGSLCDLVNSCMSC